MVGGGNTANLLAVWRVHGLDKILREAWEAGTILAGVSAGAICWFDACLTDSFGLGLATVQNGLGYLAGSACPHLDGEELRRPRLREEIAAGRLPDGYGIENGVALHFVGTSLNAVVSEVPGKAAYRFERTADGQIRETRIEATLLPDV
jgi:peptidase E